MQLQQSKDVVKYNNKISSNSTALVSNLIINSPDLINTANDPLIETVLQRLPIYNLDRLNAAARQENRKVFIIILLIFVVNKLY